LSYRIRDGIPNMLPPEIQYISDEIDKLNHSTSKFYATRTELESAGEWLARQLGLDEKDIEWGNKSGFRNQLAFTLKLCKEMKLSEDEKKIVIGMLGAKNMSLEYKNHIADQLSASGEASGYEAYEDILLRRQINEIVETGNAALIEIGSGVGRLLHQYGTCMSKRLSSNGYRYRRFARPLYSYVNKYENRLKFLIGLDFEQKMIDESTTWLRVSGLGHLLEKHRIIQIRSLATSLCMHLDSRLYKIVTILFQTLGNQLGEELQIKMLEKAKEFASPNGTVFVSVFNKASFNEQAEEYYRSIEKSVGKIAYCKNGKFLSDRGVFSLWFDVDQVRHLFEQAGMKKVKVLSDKNLDVFPEYGGYVEETDQARFKKRAIVAVANIERGN
jgi:hypothetical protein